MDHALLKVTALALALLLDFTLTYCDGVKVSSKDRQKTSFMNKADY